MKTNRKYQNKEVQEDLCQFEQGNELGAQLERNKRNFQKQFEENRKNKSAEDNLNKPYPTSNSNN